MTNSIASAKCPSSVLTSGNYGMSQNRYTDDSKEYIFVKLTDSAYRAIEEYQRNANGQRFNHGQCAKIKFMGNSGIIHFPTADNNNDNNNSSSSSSNKNNNNNSNNGRQFGFAIDEIEGSLECIQQTRNELDVLGSLSYRMRIHANEDVYDTTRTKMAIAEETEKSKCIREIKPNQTDIGRKVKKQPLTFNPHHNQQQQQQHGVNTGGNNNSNSNTSSNFSNSLNRLKGAVIAGSSPSNINVSNGVKLGATASISRSSPNPTMLGGSGTIGNNNINNNNNNHNANNRYNSSSSSHISSSSGINSSNGTAMNSLTTASSLSSALAGGIANGYASASTTNNAIETNSKRLKLSSGSSSVSFRGAGSGNGNSIIDHTSSLSSTTITQTAHAGSKSLFGMGNSAGSKGSNSSNGKLPDISRRKIRERLIHLLALKPFKKPELYARLQNEGLRERERPLISNILKDISTMSRDNTYNLRRQMWNDVNENWPYYTEQELQLLKRRKPQNLTPPLSSDAGSSTSGQSPTSTHTGSPPPIVSNMLADSGGGGGSGKSLKRSMDYDETLLSSVQPKKQRISHYRKDSLAPTTVIGNINANSGGYGGNSRTNFGISNNSSSSGGVLSKGGSNTNFSPSRQVTTTHANSDENYNSGSGVIVGGETDLSYNILENADDFMSHLERNSSSNGFYGNSGGNNSRKTGGGSSSSSSTTSKNANNNSTTHKTSSPRNIERNDNSRDKFRKSYVSANSPSTAYSSSFVPENKSSTTTLTSGGGVSGNGCGGGGAGGNRSNNNLNNGFYQRQSPTNYAQQNHKNINGNKNAASIFSTRTATANSASNSPRDEPPTPSTTTSRRGGNSGNSNSNSSSSNRFQNKNSRTPTPPMLRHQQTQHHHHNVPTNETTPPPPPTTTTTTTANTPLAHHSQQQQQEQSSPSQQIADAATAYASAYSASSPDDNKPRYDFSNYTPITTIEQRRQYKTEFESDYDEYLKLLNQIEGVGKRFRSLAARLENARKGCPEFNDIKEEIVSEYERIRNAETLKRDKQRFDYLHEKLAYIKQLVTDYDKTLTGGGNGGGSNNNNHIIGTTTASKTTNLTSIMPSPNQQQQQQLQRHNHDYHDTRQQQQQQLHQHQMHRTHSQQQQSQLSSSTMSTTSPLHHHLYNDGNDEHLVSSQPHQQQQRTMLSTESTLLHAYNTTTHTNELMNSKIYHQQQHTQATTHHHHHQQQHHQQAPHPRQQLPMHNKRCRNNDSDDSDGSSDLNDEEDDDEDNDGDEVNENMHAVGINDNELNEENEDDLEDDDDSYSNNSNGDHINDMY